MAALAAMSLTPASSGTVRRLNSKLNLFPLALFAIKMVTSSCIHLRLLNVNFLCGAFTDLHVHLQPTIYTWQFHLIMWSLAARTGCTLQNSKCDHVGSFSKLMTLFLIIIMFLFFY
jgi:uncharacterized membrane protein AbrB (regulator of aidB expression)